MLTGGVEVGELVVLSPMERSRVELTLKVLDASDPNTVLVDPPKPDWAKQGAAEGESSEKTGDKKEKRGWGKKKNDEAQSGAKKKTTSKKEEPESKASGGDSNAERN